VSFIDTILSKLAPYECLSCSTEGCLACPRCLNELLIKDQECYRCRQLSAMSLTCDECRSTSGLYRAQAPVIYKSTAKDLVWRLKSSGAKAAAQTMALQMAPLISPEIALIVPAPTASSRVRQRGYDQSRLLARHLSRLSGIPWADCLVRSGQAHQVGSDKDHRLQQLQTAFRVKSGFLLRGSHILIVDDVITTGATIEAVANILKEAGASRVEALAFARPKLNKKHP
jgi:ComF family protein